MLSDAAKEEPDLMQKFTDAQKNYAQKNNFTVDSSK